MNFLDLKYNIICDICNHTLNNFFSGTWRSDSRLENYTCYTCNCIRSQNKSPFCLDSISTGVFYSPEENGFSSCLVMKNKDCLILFDNQILFEFSYIESSLNPAKVLRPSLFNKFNSKKSEKEITDILPLIRKDLISYNNNLIFD
jgi:hypothetical protein